MKDVNTLLQKRASIYEDMKAIQDKCADSVMNADDATTYGNLEKAFDDLTADIENAKKQNERDRLMGEVADKAQKPEQTANLWAKALSGKPEDIAAYKNVDYTLGTGATAGYLTAPMEFRQELIKGLDDILFMRQIAHNVGTIGAAQSLGFPYRATEAADAEWKAEVAAAPEEQTLAYGQREFKPNRMAKLIKLSRTLVGHAPIAERTVLDEMQYRIGITQEKAYMTGDGSGKPLGIFTASNSGIPTSRDIATDNTSTAITFDGLMNAKYAIKQQYLPNASWVFHRDAVKMIAKLKDEEGRYVWQPSTVEGQPDRLLGHPVYMSEYAPNTFTTGLYVGCFGDFNYYWICDADALEVQVLNELYATTNQVGYLFNYFGDGAPVVGEAFARVTLG